MKREKRSGRTGLQREEHSGKKDEKHIQVGMGIIEKSIQVHKILAHP